MRQRREGIKRLFDLLIASTALVILSPLLFALVVFVRLFLGSPFIFRQQRPGLHSKPFTLYKFRTMTDARDSQGNLLFAHSP